MSALGVTQAALALDCDIDVRTVQRWFAGQRVSLADAERMAALLGVGTAELFEGVAEDSAAAVSSRLRMLVRLLSARDTAFAQGFRLLDEHFLEIQQCVSLMAHPARGFVSRNMLKAESCHGFVVFNIRVGERADIAIRAQLGRQFGYIIGRIRVRGERVFFIETFSVRSMLAKRTQDGSVLLWVWIGPETRELIFTSDTELSVTESAAPERQLFDLAAPGAEHTLCLRPNPIHLRVAGLPMGFDRVVGPRADRVDIPLRWEDTGVSA